MSNTLPYVSVGELAQAFAPESNTLPRSRDLVGKTLNLHIENGQVIEHRFETGNKIAWYITSGAGKGRRAEETYFATKVREGIYFVDFVRQLERATTDSLVLDLNQGIFTSLVGQLPSASEAKRDFLTRVLAGGELTSVKATFLSGSINKSFSMETPRHTVTHELVGKRVEYTYSPTERYEHVYLNENFFTWHCLDGAEKGLADTDRCHYYKLADNLYLFAWREKVVPTLGAVVVDLAKMKTAGKIFGYKDNDFGKLSDFPVGAKARLLNTTRRD